MILRDPDRFRGSRTAENLFIRPAAAPVFWWAERDPAAGAPGGKGQEDPPGHGNGQDEAG